MSLTVSKPGGEFLIAVTLGVVATAPSGDGKTVPYGAFNRPGHHAASR